MNHECKHGRLARKCEICWLEGEVKSLEETFMHTFRSPQEGGDSCDICGLDIRSAVHRRMNDNRMSWLDKLAR